MLPVLLLVHVLLVHASIEFQHAQYLHAQGVRGQSVDVAIVDSGIHPKATVRHIAYAGSWIPLVSSPDDAVGHGTSVAGLVASTQPRCPGLAPESKLHIYRLFESHTTVPPDEWFMRALEHIRHRRIPIINLSNGDTRPSSSAVHNMMDTLVAAGSVVVASTGNGGHHHSPSEQLSVLAVGAVDREGRMAPYSSRGTTRDGHLKPNLVALGSGLRCLRPDGIDCVRMSGTSMATPLVSGAIALLLSARHTLRPGQIQQILMETATRLQTGATITEQGAGRLNLRRAYEYLSVYRPHISAHPSSLDLDVECPYLGSICKHTLFFLGPVLWFNITLISGQTLNTPIHSVEWRSSSSALRVGFQYSSVCWPYTGYLELRLQVAHAIAHPEWISGSIHVNRDELVIPVRFQLTPPPTRLQRKLKR